MLNIPNKLSLILLKEHGNLTFLKNVSIIFLGVMSLTICQDYFESIRSNYSFNLDEAMLFNANWILFIPFITVLYLNLKNNGALKAKFKLLYIAVPIFSHLLVLPIILTLFSVIFFSGTYDFYKFITYTTSHDIYKVVSIYSLFVLAYVYLFNGNKVEENKSKPREIKSLIVKNGRKSLIINVEDILVLSSAKPYITIKLLNNNYLYSDTLKSIYNQLDKRTFIQVHKSYIVNITSIKSYQSRQNGDYDLVLINDEKIRLSRTYAMQFFTVLNSDKRVSI